MSLWKKFLKIFPKENFGKFEGVESTLGTERKG